jgi:hypothetical protein
MFLEGVWRIVWEPRKQTDEIPKARMEVQRYGIHNPIMQVV